MNSTETYIHNLKNLLDGRRIRNQRYSLRALARDIGVDHAYLAHIMNGNKPVTPKIAYKIAKTLELEGEQLLKFILPALQ